MASNLFTATLVLAPALLALSVAQPVYACAKDPCPMQVWLFDEGELIPGNLVYFKLLDDPPTDLSLSTADGSPIAASVRTIGADTVFAPDADIPADTDVVFSYRPKPCQGFASEGEVRAFAFTTTAPLEPELGTADLTVVQSGDEGPETDLVRFVDLRFETPDLNGALTHLTFVQATIDGTEYWMKDIAGGRGVRVATRCTSDGMPYDVGSQSACGNVEEVEAGEHVVKVTARAVGIEEPIAVLERTIVTKCDDFFAPSKDALLQEGDAHADDGGCSTSSSHTHAGSLLLSAWVLVWRARRRRGSER